MCKISEGKSHNYFNLSAVFSLFVVLSYNNLHLAYIHVVKFNVVTSDQKNAKFLDSFEKMKSHVNHMI